MKKQWLIIVGASLLLAIGFGVLIHFQHQKIEKGRADAATLRTRIEDSRRLIKRTPDLENEVIIQRETDEVIKEILSDEEDINNFVRTLRRFEEESEISITSIKKQKSRRQTKKNKEDFDRVGYTLSFEAGAFELLSFLHQVESHPRFMSVTAFKLSSAPRQSYEKGEDGPRHKLQLDLETYVYKPTEGAAEVRIDGYDRKRERLASEINRSSKDLRFPVYDYRGTRARRDPWVDPRVPVSGDGAPMLTIEEQITIVDELQDKADEVQSIWSQVQEAPNVVAEMKARAELEQKMSLLEEEVRRVESANQIVFAPCARRLEVRVVGVLEGVRGQIAASESGRGPSVAALREAADAMSRHMAASEWDLSIGAFRAVEGRLKLAERDEFKRPLVMEIRRLEQLVRTVLAFEEISLQIGGIAMLEGRRPVALINNRSVSEGESLGEDLWVFKIREDEIEFIFRDVHLGRLLDK